jgi:general secretion pathway protein J
MTGSHGWSGGVPPPHLARGTRALLFTGMAYRRRRRPRGRAGTAGFTLLEALVAVTLTGIILAAMGYITAQWLPSWNRGFMRVQRGELFSVALNRLAADLAAAEFVTPNRDSKLPLFEGTPTAVTLLRSAVGPNTEPGLEVVRIAEGTDRQGVALVRTRTPFAPFGSGDVSASQLSFADPVVLLRAPFRVSFSYSSGDGAWQDTWQKSEQLPAAVRFLVRDTATGRTLAISSAAMVHVDQQAGCADTGAQGGAPGSQSGAPGSQSGGPGSQSGGPGSQSGGPGSQSGAPGSQGCAASNTPGAPVNAGPAPNGPIREQ